jgi:hypothetical protein
VGQHLLPMRDFAGRQLRLDRLERQRPLRPRFAARPRPVRASLEALKADGVRRADVFDDPHDDLSSACSTARRALICAWWRR